MPLPLCCLALDDILVTTLLLTLTRSRMTTGGAGREEGGPQVPGQNQGEIRIATTVYEPRCIYLWTLSMDDASFFSRVDSSLSDLH